MNTDNEKTLMQSLRVSESGTSDLLSLPVFSGFGSEDEILAAWQEGALSTEQEAALKAALATSNSLRQQWLALSAAVPMVKHGAVWHGLFRWHWATIGMTASVALVGVLLFRQGQLPMAPAETAVMHEPVADRSLEAARVESDALAGREQSGAEAKAFNGVAQKRQLASEEARRSMADSFAQDSAEIESIEMDSAPLMEERSRVAATPQPGPLAVAPSSAMAPATLAPEEAPAWQEYLNVYREGLAADPDSDMALLAQAALAVEASGCAAANVAALQQAFDVVKAQYPNTFVALEPDSPAGWCGLGTILDEAGRNAGQ